MTIKIDQLDQLAGGQPLLGGRVVIMTGCGGMGSRIAEVLALAGATMALTDIEFDGVRETQDRIEDTGGRCIIGAFDAADEGAFGAFHREVVDELGPVDGLINCAGGWTPQPVEEATTESYEHMVRINLQTAWTGCRTLLPQMRERRNGSIVNFASTAGEFGSITPAAHYAAAKGGVIALTKSLAREAGPFDVRVNALSPGPIQTPALGAVTPDQVASVSARTLFGRIGTPEEIAGGCLYLLSPLSTYVTGSVLQINGGSCL